MRIKSKVHFIGIGGIGMSCLAHILLQKGIQVSGSDIKINDQAARLIDAGAVVIEGHHKDKLPHDATIVYSSAIAKTNEELSEAYRLNYSILHRSDLLNAVIGDQKALVVTGTHGKTTTSALVAHILKHADCHPSYAIGGHALNFSRHGEFDLGKYFVVEGDESDGSFLKLNPYGTIVTNLDFDHLDYWKNRDKLIEAFREFIHRPCKGPVVWGSECRYLMQLKPPGNSVGFDQKADYQICMQSRTSFWLKGSLFNTPLMGKHNMLNAGCAIALCMELGVPIQTIQNALETFLGVKRRQEKIGYYQESAIYDDYAHHPTEILASIESFRSYMQGKGRLVVIFQPHRPSRIRHLLKEFQEALSASDYLILTPIYSAGEPVDQTLFYQLVEGIHTKLAVAESFEEIPSLLEDQIEKNDIILTMGAGHITEVSQLLKSI